MKINHVTKFRNGRSLRETAEELGVSHSHVDNLEKGLAVPSYEWLFTKANTAESQAVREFAAGWLAELYPERMVAV